MFSYFIWNGVHSRDMGIYLSGPAPIMRGKERVSNMTVLGRPGTLTLTEGEDVYEPYTVQLTVRAREPINTVYRWLRGSGYVTFSGEPDVRQPARIVGQVQLTKISKHLSYWEGNVQFYCQPLKELIHEPEYAVTNGAQLVNLGDVTEKPVFTFDGAYGDIALGIGDSELVIANLPQEAGGCVVDCDAGYVLSFDRTQLLTNLSAGDFPTIPVGTSTLRIGGSHTGTVTIGRRQRWL